MGALTIRLPASYHAAARRDLEICLGAYLVLAAILGYLLRDTTTPDGVIYSRLATYLARGDFELGIVSSWSPLLPWSMAPLVAAGVDPLHADRATAGARARPVGSAQRGKQRLLAFAAPPPAAAGEEERR